VLAWIAAEDGEPVRAVVMMAAAEAVGRSVGNWAFVFPGLPAFHEECVDRVRDAISADAYEAASAEGGSMRLNDAVAYALA
jgi:serine/threonine-protein kinase PknK